MRRHVLLLVAIILALVTLVDAQSGEDCGFFASLFDNCPTSSAPSPAPTGAPPSQSPKPSAPEPSSKPAVTSAAPSAKPSSAAPSAKPSASDQKPTPSATRHEPASDSATDATSPTPSDHAEDPVDQGNQNNNGGGSTNTTAIIAGSVCGGVAAIGAAIGLFVLTRRRNKKKHDNQDIFQDHFHSPDDDLFTVRPTAATAAAVAADSVQSNQQHGWNNYNDPSGAYGYGGYMSPQQGYAGVGHDAYYSQAAATTHPEAAYHAGGYSDYNPYGVPMDHNQVNSVSNLGMGAPGMTASEPVYSAPNAYDDAHPPTSATPLSGQGAAMSQVPWAQGQGHRHT